MRPHEVFAAMSQDQSESFFGRLAEESPMMFTQALGVAANAMKSRPQYLLKQPLEKRVAAIRRALSRVAARNLSEEVLAVYFLECRKDLLIQWLDLLALEHEDGVLKDSAPQSPSDEELQKKIESFLGEADEPDNELLLKAFAAQTAIDWPKLDELIESRAG